MQSNAYLTLIIGSVLITMLSGFFAYNLRKETLLQIEKNVTAEKLVSAGEQDIEARTVAEREMVHLILVHQTEARKIATGVQMAVRHLKALEHQKIWFDQRLGLHTGKSAILLRQQGEVKDEMREEISNVDRTKQELESLYEISKESFEKKEEKLKTKDDEDLKNFKFKESKLSSEVKERENKINREHQVVYRYIERPEPVGRVVEYLHTEKMAIIDLGRIAGIKQNFKFAVFDVKPNGDLIEKGFLLIKTVEDLYSVASLLYQNDKAEPILAGDRIGCPAYHSKGRNFYLAGRIESKFTKEQLREHLLYMGNHVLDELTPKVDIVVEGSHAEIEVADAANMGIRLIREKQLVPYLGD